MLGSVRSAPVARRGHRRHGWVPPRARTSSSSRSSTQVKKPYRRQVWRSRRGGEAVALQRPAEEPGLPWYAQPEDADVLHRAGPRVSSCRLMLVAPPMSTKRSPPSAARSRRRRRASVFDGDAVAETLDEDDRARSRGRVPGLEDDVAALAAGAQRLEGLVEDVLGLLRRSGAPSRRRGASCTARSSAAAAGCRSRGSPGRPQRGQSQVSGICASTANVITARAGASRSR